MISSGEDVKHDRFPFEREREASPGIVKFFDGIENLFFGRLVYLGGLRRESPHYDSLFIDLWAAIK